MDAAKKRGMCVSAIFFLIFLTGFSLANLWHGRQPLLQELHTFDMPGIQKDLDDLNTVMQENILGRYQWLNAYGAVQLALGKHEENAFDILKDRNGFLYSGNFWSGFGDDQRQLAIRTRRLLDAMRAQGTNAGFILCPMRLAENDARYLGLPYNDHTEDGDEFLRWLRYYGVPYLDLREELARSSLPYEERWFRTDHYWTPSAAFEAYQATVGWIGRTWGADLDPGGFYRDSGNYETKLYPGSMLGYYGRDSGLVFAGGMEDYLAVIPQPDGRRYRWESEGEVVSSGDFRTAFLDMKLKDVKPDELNAGKFYLGEIQNECSLVNEDLEQAPSILIIRDSFASPVGAFLAQNCSVVDMLWSKQFSPEEMEEKLHAKKYDYVFVMLSVENLSEKNFSFYVD